MKSRLDSRKLHTIICGHICHLVFHIRYADLKNFMSMEEDGENRTECEDTLRQLLPLIILWVLCVTSAVVTFTSGDGKNGRNLEQCFIQWSFEYNSMLLL